MACKDAYKNKTKNKAVENAQPETQQAVAELEVKMLLFGVDSKVPSNDVLQNNITEFEWVTRNKLYPNFWGRNIIGEDSLTVEEIDFLHRMGCRIAAIYTDGDAKETEEQGKLCAKKAAVTALRLGIHEGAAIFLEIAQTEAVTAEYMKGYAQTLINEGYTPAFKTITDAAAYGFDREYSRGMQSDKELFGRCLIWAVTPSLEEYERITTSHLIHPDNWVPYAPSGITRSDIAVWQYGKNCHPINDDAGKETVFNLNLVRNPAVIINAMF